MIEFSLRQLRYALALAEIGHFGRAAEKCHITQPALSQQIKLLEEACETALFDRFGRTIKPTPFGQDFLSRAAHVLKEYEALNQFVLSKSGGPTRPIRFGLIPTVAPYLLPGIYPALTANFPEAEFNISESHTDLLVTELQNGTLDIALLATSPPPHAHLTARSLFADPFVLASCIEARFPQVVDLRMLPKDQILLLDEGHCFRDQAIDACALHPSDQPRAFAATSLSTIVEFVANGQGITLLPTISLRKEAANPRIRIHQLAAPGASRNLQLVWRANSPFEPTFVKIADVIRSAGQSTLSTPMSGTV